MGIKIIQPVLANYRCDFFNRLNSEYKKRNIEFKVFYSSVDLKTNIFSKKKVTINGQIY